MADDFTERYGDLLDGSYHCVDRVVLNAFFPIGHNPGGFRSWWRRLHGGSDDRLDDTHLMRMAGRFAVALSGARNFREAGDHAADLPQDVLGRLGGRPHPLLGLIVGPSETRIRTLVQAIGAGLLDEVIGG